MLNSGIIWKMAWNQLRRQKLHTVLSVIGGSVGVTLVIAAVVFYQSFDYSEQRWVKAHFGPIEWELVPAEGAASFTGDEVRKIVGYPGNQAAGIAYVPAVRFAATAIKPGGPGQAGEAAERVTVLGLDLAAAAAVDPGLDPLKSAAPGDDQAVVSEPAARLLGLAPGDALGIMDARREVVYLRVAAIAEERGLAGYRDGTLSTGTLLMNERTARRLAGLADGEYSVVFATNPTNPDYMTGDVPSFPFSFSHAVAVNQKAAAVTVLQQWKWTYATALALASGFAAVAGMLLIRQILLLQLDLRREAAAVLRAIGLDRRQVGLIFFAEAGLIVSLCTLAGAVAGSAAGYGIIRLFQASFAETLMKYSTLSIPLVPYLSVRTVLLTAACLLAFLLIAARLIGRRAGRVPIVPTLRAGTGGTAEAGPRPAVRRTLFVASGAVVAVYLYDVWSGTAVERLVDHGAAVTYRQLSIVALWLAASVAMLYVLLFSAERLESRFRRIGRLCGIAPVSAMLAFRYPAHKRNRSFAVALMFSLVFTVLTAAITYAAPMLRFQAANAASQTFLGYPAVVPYANGEERARIEALIQNDEVLREAIRHSTALEPYRLDLASPGTLVGKRAFSIIPAEAAFLRAARLPLSSRAAEFASDEEAWNAVLNGDDYVILHEKFAYAASEWPGDSVRNGLPVRRLKPGDAIDVVVYPNLQDQLYTIESDLFRPLTEAEARDLERRFREEIEERQRIENTPVGVRTLKIAGFAAMEEEIAYYNAWFVPPAFAEMFRSYGHRWEDDPPGGYILLDVDLGDLEKAHRVQERFLLAGIDGLMLPSLKRTAQSTMDRHTYLIYITFMVVSVVIGLAGLAIVQHRAVLERARQVAMMRFIGIGRRQIAHMFVLEGSWIGWTGIWNGALFGTLGGRSLLQTMEAVRPPAKPPIPLDYPWVQVAVILAGAMLTAWLLNLWPARRGNRLPPAEAIRIAD